MSTKLVYELVRIAFTQILRYSLGREYRLTSQTWHRSGRTKPPRGTTVLAYYGGAEKHFTVLTYLGGDIWYNEPTETDNPQPTQWCYIEVP